MKHISTSLTSAFQRPLLLALISGIVAAIIPDIVLAQFYNGPGILGGLQQAQAVGGVTDTNIRSVILDILLAILLYMGLAAVVVIVIAGIWLVVSVGDEQAKEKAKKIILYALAGLVVIALAAALVLIIINATDTGGIFGPVPTLGNSGDPEEIILGILFGILIYMGLAAVVVIVIAGIYMVISLGDEQAVGRAKRIILYAIVGLIVIALAGAIVMIIASATGAEGIFGNIPETGGDGTVDDPRGTVLSILDGVLQFMALIAVIVIVIAGIYMVVSLGDEQALSRAKRIILYAVIGLIVILLASAIVGIISAAATNT